MGTSPGRTPRRGAARRPLPLLLLLLCSRRGLSLEVESDLGVDGDARGYQDDSIVSTVLYASQVGKLNSTACHEDDGRYFPIITQKVWGDWKLPVKTSPPVEFVVVRDEGDGSPRCTTHADCARAVRSLRLAGFDLGRSCALLENFYVGDGGHVYEGRGWDLAPYWHLNGLRRKAVTFQFLGSHGGEGPSEAAVDAFHRAVRVGVWQGKVSTGHHVVSMGQAYGDPGLVGDALENTAKEWKRWQKDLDPLTTWEIFPPRTLPLVVRERWGALRSKSTRQMPQLPIEYVVILEGGERCHSKVECTSRIQGEQNATRPLYGDLLENFYVGEDGNVYEGRGFGQLPVWHVRGMKDKYVTVQFFGNFTSDHPSLSAISALKLLVNTGVWMGKISPKFKMYSLRGIYDDEKFLGDGLLRCAEKWTPWAHHIDKMPLDVREMEGFLPVVNRTGWDAMELNTTADNIEHPVDYVMIKVLPTLRHCVKWSACSSLVRSLQSFEEIKENFLIGDDGNIYEGRGWSLEPKVQIKYFKKSYFTIRFIGPYEKEDLTLPAIRAFESLVRFGVEAQKISPDYQIYSLREIYAGGHRMSKKVDDYFKKSYRWASELEEISKEERLSKGLLPFSPREDWAASDPKKTFHQFNDPIKYVILGDTGGTSCLNTADCIASMQSEQDEGISMYGDIGDNFYIGEDGIAYEGRGWNNASSWFVPAVTKEFIAVNFIGQFENSAVSDMAILSFFSLLDYGVKTGKLEENYKLVTLKQIFDNRTTYTFEEHIRHWHHWTDDLNFFYEVERTPSGLLLVSREDWRAKATEQIVYMSEYSVKYIIVHDTGDHCEDLAGCISSVKSLQENITFRHWDIEDNYYIGDDGHYYEGRADQASHWHTKGIQNLFMSVGFLGSFQSSSPSKKALDAFHFLTTKLIREMRLPPDFKIVSLGHVFDDDSMVGGKLIEELRKSEHWSDVTSLTYDRARLRSLREPLVLIEEWQTYAEKIRRANRLQHPLKHVVVRDGGEPCDTYQACVKRMRMEYETGANNETSGLKENFYVGDDGFVYEGIGWDWDMLLTADDWERSLSVHFLGTHERELPSPKALDAFKKVLLKGGVETGKLAQDYNIVTLPEKQGPTIGKRLKDELLSWNTNE